LRRPGLEKKDNTTTGRRPSGKEDKVQPEKKEGPRDKHNANRFEKVSAPEGEIWEKEAVGGETNSTKVGLKVGSRKKRGGLTLASAKPEEDRYSLVRWGGEITMRRGGREKKGFGRSWDSSVAGGRVR